MARRRERGFTFIELVTTLAVGSIASTVILGSVLMFQQNSQREMDASGAQQSARASLAILDSRIRQAGFGIPPGQTVGPIVIGSCTAADGVTCNGVDGGSDRLRIASVDPDSRSVDSAWEPGNSLIRAQDRSLYSPCPPAIPTGTEVLVSGRCPDDVVRSSVLTIDGDNDRDGQWCHKYHWSGHPACAWANDLVMESARMRVVDFYVSRSDPRHPVLMFDPDASGPRGAVSAAWDIDDLQVQYGVDTSTPPDRVVERWCDQLDTASCPTGVASARENQARVVAVRVAVVARTASPEAGYVSPPLTVFDHAIPGGDAYHRWVYRAVIKLRSVNP